MWRQVAQAKGASASGARHQSKRLLGAADASSQLHHQPKSCCASTRYFSSAQPSSWDDNHTPFTMSSAPAMGQMQNPTAERIVVKTFLDTLQVSAVESSAAQVIESEEPHGVVEENEHMTMNSTVQVVEEQDSSLVAVSSVVSISREKKEESESRETSNEKQYNQQATKIQRKSHGRLLHAIRSNNVAQARLAFRECLETNVDITRKYLVNLFNVVVMQDPITAFAVLKHYRKVVGTPASPALYVNLCEQVGTVPWQVARTGQFTKLCNDLRDELVDLPKEGKYQQRCYPYLLVSLVKQPMHRIGLMARGLYSHMEKNDYPLSIGTMCYILNAARYTRNRDLCFPAILARVVDEGTETGFRPDPPTVINVLQNLFPYTDIDETISAMKSIIQLQSSWEPGDEHPNYKVDIGMLEHIMAAAARTGSFELNILVWDLVDLLGYEPTEVMYENTMQGFVMGVRQDQNAFIVLGEMEERGFKPNRALIRSLSRSIRFSGRRVDHGYELLTERKPEGTHITQASLNVLLSAAAELGDVDRTFATFDDFDAYGIEPNTDSYSFLLEALCKSVSPLMQKDEEQRRQDAPGRMDAASAILSLMEENGVTMCHHCIEQYAQLLHNVDRLDAATEFIVDSLERGDPVNNKVIINLSKNNALAGNIEVARLLAARTSEPFAHLDRKIDEIEEELASQSRGEARDSTLDDNSDGEDYRQ